MDLNKRALISGLFYALITAVTTTGMVAFLLFWASIDETEIEPDTFTVTIEYNCKDVIASPAEYTPEIVEECNVKARSMMKASI